MELDGASSYWNRDGLLSTFFRTDLSSFVKELRKETILIMESGKGAQLCSNRSWLHLTPSGSVLAPLTFTFIQRSQAP